VRPGTHPPLPAIGALGLAALLASAILAPVRAGAGMPFATTPDWVSADLTDVSTGGALVDLDRDGWLDLVVSNGNDMARQPLVVYYNRGDGTFPDYPDWSSLSAEYHGQLSVGDVNQDGWPDVAVSVFLGPAGFDEPGWAALYLNDGAGVLPATPSWQSAERFYTFAVALGDADGDGDLDLAVATGEDYYHLGQPEPNYLYYNQGGTLGAAAGWVSWESEHNFGLAWGDADGDGLLDLAFSGAFAPHRIHFQGAGGLPTSSGWESAPATGTSTRCALGDIDRDGRADFAVAQNNQLGGDGHVLLFAGTPGGISDTQTWTSAYEGYSSEALLGDANDDGWLDLLTGGWGANSVYSDQVRIHPNRYVRPPDAAPAWVSATGSVVERVLLGDVNNDGLRQDVERFPGDGARKAFRLRRVPFRDVLRVTSDGSDLPPDEYAFSAEEGWISLAEAPGVLLEVEYSWSGRLDMVVLNWDANQGNFLFYAREPVLLRVERGPTRTEARLYWSGGLPPFDVLESADPAFGPGLELKAEGLTDSEWTDLPGALFGRRLVFYKVC